MDTDDAKGHGRPSPIVVQKNIKKVQKIVLEEQKVKLHEIAGTLKMSKAKREDLFEVGAVICLPFF